MLNGNLGGIVAVGVPKIDDQAVNGLSGVPNSLAYMLQEVEKHHHNTQQVYGLTANKIARKSTAPVVVTGGSDAWGTELMLHDGATIEGGSATQKFDMHQLYVSAVGTANRITYLEFYSYLAGAGIACTFQDAGDTVTKVGHGFVGGEKLQLESIVGTTGINTYTIYYVINVVGDTFQLSLTSGGAAVVLTTDGTGTYFALAGANAQTLISESVVSKANVNSDVLEQPMRMVRQACNRRVSCRGWAAGGTNAISFFLGLHTYVG